MLVALRQALRCRAAAILILALPGLAACALPAAGPTSSELEGSVSSDNFEYKLVNVDERVAAILHHYGSPGFGGRFKGARYKGSNKLAPGDTVAITVYEGGGASLFQQGAGAQSPLATGASVSTIPPQTIESDGTIFMPFIGRINIANQTPSEVAALITERLRGKTVEPQVIVTPSQNVTNTATVGGDVVQPRLIALTLRGERVLDAVAGAGGAKYPAYDTYVRLIRQGTTGVVLLQTIINNPEENVVLRPNDQLYLVHNPRTFAVLGATQKVSQFTFDTEKVTLAEAVARAGGPIDTVGDPSGIYLFRFEPYAVAKEVLNVPDIEVAGAHPPFVPILYKVGLKNAEGYFVSQAVQMRDKDVVLITNSGATQLQKFMAIVRGFTGVAFDLTRTTVVH
jgi:polysaccharide export outer membrane protein